MRKYQIAEMVPHYQPIVRINDEEVIMYECLGRFRDSKGNGVGPIDIPDLFENSNFLWDVFEKQMNAVVPLVYKKNAIITINTDVNTINDRFIYFIDDFFTNHPGLAQNIHFEVIEKNITTENLNKLGSYVKQMQKLGAKVALDDFGCGGANIDCLEKIKFDYVKVDGQFLTGAVKSPQGYQRLKLIIDLLKSYNTAIVGEHIETEAIACIANDLKVDYGQGHLYGHPSPVLMETKNKDDIPPYPQNLWNKSS